VLAGRRTVTPPPHSNIGVYLYLTVGVGLRIFIHVPLFGKRQREVHERKLYEIVSICLLTGSWVFGENVEMYNPLGQTSPPHSNIGDISSNYERIGMKLLVGKLVY